MTSKKTSQAQPAEPWGLMPPQVGHEKGDTARGEGDFGRFECPVWPPADPEIWSRLESLYRSGDWGRYFPGVVTELRDLIGRFLDGEVTAQGQGQQVRLVCSGSAAVELALRVTLHDRLPGETHLREVRGRAGGEDLPPEVICGVFDYPGNARAIRLLGALPVFVDTRPGGGRSTRNRLQRPRHRRPRPFSFLISTAKLRMSLVYRSFAKAVVGS